MRYLIGIIILVIWLYALSVFRRGHLQSWYFIVGSAGLFILMMLYVQPVLTEPLARAVAAIAGLLGDFTGTFHAYFKYGILFIQSGTDAITLQIDFECSGIIEIMAYLALLTFFKVYEPLERLAVGILGTLYLMLANALRIIVICEMIHYMGTDVYHFAHTIVGRLVFYALSILLYFYVFTKSQIVRMRIGKFNYGTGE